MNQKPKNVFLKIVVYGGSRPNEETRQQAFELGRLLGSKYQVMAGAGGGVPEAFLAGAAETALSDNPPIEIGTTWDQEKDRLSKNPNIKQMVVKDFNTNRTELLNADAAIVFPGAIGTLAEVVAAIDNIGMDLFMDRPIKPIIFIGDFWKKFINENIVPIINQKAKPYIIFENDIKGVLNYLS